MLLNNNYICCSAFSISCTQHCELCLYLSNPLGAERVSEGELRDRKFGKFEWRSFDQISIFKIALLYCCSVT